MEKSVKQSIVQKLQVYMNLHGMSQSDVASRAEVSKSYVNIILKEGSDFTYTAGNKTGDIADKYFYALAELCGYELEKVYWEMKSTPQMLAALSVLQDAKQFGGTNVIIGETGSGKSFTTALFANRHPLDTFVVVVGSSDTLTDLIDKVIDALKITGAKSKSAKLRAIAKQLREMRAQGHAPHLIFDEAEYMKQPALCAIKELIDAIEKYCAITLIGTDQLTTNLEKLRKKNRAGIPQFYRRVKFGIRMLPGIDRRYSQFITEIEDKALIKWLQSYCDNYGELQSVLVPALREADRTKEPLSVPFVKKVLNLPDTMYV